MLKLSIICVSTLIFKQESEIGCGGFFFAALYMEFVAAKVTSMFICVLAGVHRSDSYRDGSVSPELEPEDPIMGGGGGGGRRGGSSPGGYHAHPLGGGHTQHAPRPTSSPKHAMSPPHQPHSSSPALPQPRNLQVSAFAIPVGRTTPKSRPRRDSFLHFSKRVVITCAFANSPSRCGHPH